MKRITFILGLIFVSIVSFASLAIAGSSSLELLDNRIITPVYINGQGPFFMMFDTGATNILSDEVATALQLRRYDKFPISGGGENTVFASYCDVQKLEISAQTLQNSRFICMDLADMQRAIGFPRLDGLIGYEVLAQFLTEINFDKMEISLKPFSERTSDEITGQRVPFTFHGTIPLIEAVLDGVSGKFWLDTGDRASATLAPLFIQQNFLREKYQPTFSMMTGYGLGGPMKTSMVFVDRFELGGLVFSDTLIRLPTMNSQALSTPGIAGTIGTGLLRQFNIVLDYSRREMFLSRNAAFEQDRAFDRSGMWISPDQGGFQVRDVLERGPAWNAGLRANQLILSINGVDTANIDILALREQLKDPRNKEITIVIKEGAGTRTLSITLKNLIEAP